MPLGGRPDYQRDYQLGANRVEKKKDIYQAVAKGLWNNPKLIFYPKYFKMMDNEASRKAKMILRL